MEIVKYFSPVWFQIFQFYPRKMCKSPKIENGGCITHLFWTNCQFLCIYLLKYRLIPVVLPEFGKFHRKGNFSRWTLKSLPEPENILYSWQNFIISLPFSLSVLFSLSLNNSLTCPDMFVDWLNVMDAWSGVFGNSVVQ